MASAPTVLFPLTLPALLNRVLTSQTQASPAPTTLIICSSREAFLQALLPSLLRHHGAETNALQQLIAPTLHNLVTARHVNMVFCASVQALSAHLTAYEGSTAEPGGAGLELKGKEVLALVNPLSLHAPTPAYSAQGLSRTFALAIETALRIGANLVLVECVGMRGGSSHHSEKEDEDEDEDDAIEPPRNDEESVQVETDQDPWEQEVPILNVSARSFGSGNNERSWAGRTVKVKRVASRWFQFCQVNHDRG